MFFFIRKKWSKWSDCPMEQWSSFSVKVSYSEAFRMNTPGWARMNMSAQEKWEGQGGKRVEWEADSKLSTKRQSQALANVIRHLGTRICLPDKFQTNIKALMVKIFLLARIGSGKRTIRQLSNISERLWENWCEKASNKRQRQRDKLRLTFLKEDCE